MKKKRKGPMTAAELMQELEADPEYQAFLAEEERQIREIEAAGREEARELSADLARVGIYAESAWDLVNSLEPYTPAVPVLAEHLQRPYSPGTKEGIARALAVREAKSEWDLLTRLYRQEQNSRVKRGLAVAIAAAADREVIEDVIALARDRRYGPTRVLLLDALERSKDPRAHAALRELEADPDLVKEIRVILRRLDRRKR